MKTPLRIVLLLTVTVASFASTLLSSSGQQAPARPGQSATKAPAPQAKEDSAATRLLAEARAARALYESFPGFTADLVLRVDDQPFRGQVRVNASGKVNVQLGDADCDRWVRHTLGSTITHRLDNGASGGDTPCAFVDQVTDHPLGRAIRVLNDEFHSSYRIRDRQVIVVNRHMPDSRFTITVLKNHTTPEKKFLPTCFVVNTWDLRTSALKSSETHYQTWKRVGRFDLPHNLLVVKAGADKQEARELELSHFQLSK